MEVLSDEEEDLSVLTPQPAVQEGAPALRGSAAALVDQAEVLGDSEDSGDEAGEPAAAKQDHTQPPTTIQQAHTGTVESRLERLETRMMQSQEDKLPILEARVQEVDDFAKLLATRCEQMEKHLETLQERIVKRIDEGEARQQRMGRQLAAMSGKVEVQKTQHQQQIEHAAQYADEAKAAQRRLEQEIEQATERATERVSASLEEGQKTRCQLESLAESSAATLQEAERRWEATELKLQREVWECRGAEEKHASKDDLGALAVRLQEEVSQAMGQIQDGSQSLAMEASESLVEQERLRTEKGLEAFQLSITQRIHESETLQEQISSRFEQDVTRKLHQLSEARGESFEARQTRQRLEEITQETQALVEAGQKRTQEEAQRATREAAADLQGSLQVLRLEVEGNAQAVAEAWEAGRGQSEAFAAELQREGREHRCAEEAHLERKLMMLDVRMQEMCGAVVRDELEPFEKKLIQRQDEAAARRFSELQREVDAAQALQQEPLRRAAQEMMLEAQGRLEEHMERTAQKTADELEEHRRLMAGGTSASSECHTASAAYAPLSEAKEREAKEQLQELEASLEGVGRSVENLEVKLEQATGETLEALKRGQEEVAANRSNDESMLREMVASLEMHLLDEAHAVEAKLTELEARTGPEIRAHEERLEALEARTGPEIRANVERLEALEAGSAISARVEQALAPQLATLSEKVDTEALRMRQQLEHVAKTAIEAKRAQDSVEQALKETRKLAEEQIACDRTEGVEKLQRSCRSQQDYVEQVAEEVAAALDDGQKGLMEFAQELQREATASFGATAKCQLGKFAELEGCVDRQRQALEERLGTVEVRLNEVGGSVEQLACGMRSSNSDARDLERQLASLSQKLVEEQGKQEELAELAAKEALEAAEVQNRLKKEIERSTHKAAEEFEDCVNKNRREVEERLGTLQGGMRSSNSDLEQQLAALSRKLVEEEGRNEERAELIAKEAVEAIEVQNRFKQEFERSTRKAAEEFEDCVNQNRREVEERLGTVEVRLEEVGGSMEQLQGGMHTSDSDTRELERQLGALSQKLVEEDGKNGRVERTTKEAVEAIDRQRQALEERLGTVEVRLEEVGGSVEQLQGGMCSSNSDVQDLERQLAALSRKLAEERGKHEEQAELTAKEAVEAMEVQRRFKQEFERSTHAAEEFKDSVNQNRCEVEERLGALDVRLEEVGGFVEQLQGGMRSLISDVDLEQQLASFSQKRFEEQGKNEERAELAAKEAIEAIEARSRLKQELECSIHAAAEACEDCVNRSRLELEERLGTLAVGLEEVGSVEQVQGGMRASVSDARALEQRFAALSQKLVEEEGKSEERAELIAKKAVEAIEVQSRLKQELECSAHTVAVCPDRKRRQLEERLGTSEVRLEDVATSIEQLEGCMRSSNSDARELEQQLAALSRKLVEEEGKTERAELTTKEAIEAIDRQRQALEERLGTVEVRVEEVGGSVEQLAGGMRSSNSDARDLERQLVALSQKLVEEEGKNEERAELIAKRAVEAIEVQNRFKQEFERSTDKAAGDFEDSVNQNRCEVEERLGSMEVFLEEVGGSVEQLQGGVRSSTANSRDLERQLAALSQKLVEEEGKNEERAELIARKAVEAMEVQSRFKQELEFSTLEEAECVDRQRHALEEQLGTLEVRLEEVGGSVEQLQGGMRSSNSDLEQQLAALSRKLVEEEGRNEERAKLTAKKAVEVIDRQREALEERLETLQAGLEEVGGSVEQLEGSMRSSNSDAQDLVRQLASLSQRQALEERLGTLEVRLEVVGGSVEQLQGGMRSSNYDLEQQLAALSQKLVEEEGKNEKRVELTAQEAVEAIDRQRQALEERLGTVEVRMEEVGGSVEQLAGGMRSSNSDARDLERQLVALSQKLVEEEGKNEERAELIAKRAVEAIEVQNRFKQEFERSTLNAAEEFEDCVNQNRREVEERMGNLEVRLEEVGGSVEQLQGGMRSSSSALEQQLAALSHKLVEEEGRSEERVKLTAKKAVQAIDRQREALEERLGTLEAGLEEVGGSVEQLEGGMRSSNSDARDLERELAALSQRLAKEEGKNEERVELTTKESVGAIDRQRQALEERLGIVEVRVEEVGGFVGQLQGGMQSSNSDAQDLERQLAALSQKLVEEEGKNEERAELTARKAVEAMSRFKQEFEHSTLNAAEEFEGCVNHNRHEVEERLGTMEVFLEEVGGSVERLQGGMRSSNYDLEQQLAALSRMLVEEEGKNEKRVELTAKRVVEAIDRQRQALEERLGTVEVHVEEVGGSVEQLAGGMRSSNSDARDLERQLVALSQKLVEEKENNEERSELTAKRAAEAMEVQNGFKQEFERSTLSAAEEFEGWVNHNRREVEERLGTMEVFLEEVGGSVEQLQGGMRSSNSEARDLQRQLAALSQKLVEDEGRNEERAELIAKELIAKEVVGVQSSFKQELECSTHAAAEAFEQCRHGCEVAVVAEEQQACEEKLALLSALLREVEQRVEELQGSACGTVAADRCEKTEEYLMSWQEHILQRVEEAEARQQTEARRLSEQVARSAEAAAEAVEAPKRWEEQQEATSRRAQEDEMTLLEEQLASTEAVEARLQHEAEEIERLRAASTALQEGTQGNFIGLEMRLAETRTFGEEALKAVDQHHEQAQKDLESLQQRVFHRLDGADTRQQRLFTALLALDKERLRMEQQLDRAAEEQRISERQLARASKEAMEDFGQRQSKTEELASELQKEMRELTGRLGEGVATERADEEKRIVEKLSLCNAEDKLAMEEKWAVFEAKSGKEKWGNERRFGMFEERIREVAGVVVQLQDALGEMRAAALNAKLGRAEAAIAEVLESKHGGHGELMPHKPLPVPEVPVHARPLLGARWKQTSYSDPANSPGQAPDTRESKLRRAWHPWKPLSPVQEEEEEIPPWHSSAKSSARADVQRKDMKEAMPPKSPARAVSSWLEERVCRAAQAAAPASVAASDDLMRSTGRPDREQRHEETLPARSGEQACHGGVTMEHRHTGGGLEQQSAAASTEKVLDILHMAEQLTAAADEASGALHGHGPHGPHASPEDQQHVAPKAMKRLRAGPAPSDSRGGRESAAAQGGFVADPGRLALMADIFAEARIQRSLVHRIAETQAALLQRREAREFCSDIEASTRESRELGMKMSARESAQGGNPRQIVQELRSSVDVWRQRKQQCESLMRSVQELRGVGSSAVKLAEQYGIATDEACGVAPPDLGSLPLPF